MTLICLLQKKRKKEKNFVIQSKTPQGSLFILGNIEIMSAYNDIAKLQITFTVNIRLHLLY